jgi:predicted enzyme related to lactoylglutathione lyase
VQAQAGLVLGAGLAPPSENDLVVGAGATVVSQANSGRLGYLAGGTQQFMVSMNGAAYVPLLTGPAPGGFAQGSVPFGGATGSLVEDNASFFFHDVNNTLQLGGAAASANSSLAVRATKTIAVPAALSAWNGIDFQSSVLTLTAGGVAPAALSAIYIEAPTITTPAPGYVIPTAATVTIAGSPVAAGAVTISNRASLYIVDGNVSINIEPLTGSILHVRGRVGDSSALDLETDTAALWGMRLQNRTIATNWSKAFSFYQNALGNGVITMGTANVMQFGTTTGNTIIGGFADLAATRLQVVADKTIASAAGAVYDGIKFVTSAVSITGNTGITTATGFNSTTIQAPVISGDTAGLVIDSAATLYIAGPPVAGNANVTITDVLAIDIVGRVQIEATYQSTLQPAGLRMIGNIPGLVFDANAAAGSRNFAFLNGYSNSGSLQLLCSSIVGGVPNTVTSLITFEAIQGNVAVGTALGDDASKFHVVANKSVVAAAGAIWNGVNFATSTLTLTGAVTPVTALTFFQVAGSVLTAASAVATTDFYTARFGVATIAASATITNNWSLFSEGNTKLGGGLTAHSVPILIGQSPYTVLQTDFFLEVQSNGGAITVVLPALTGGAVPNGRLVCIKDSGYNATVSNITVQRGNGADKINNVVGDYTINVSSTCLWLKANTTNLDWEIV